MAAQAGLAPAPFRLTNGRTTFIPLCILKLAFSMGLAPTIFPQTTGCFSIQLREQMVGSAGNAPVRHFQFYFATSDLQSDNWITSLGGPAQAMVAGVRITLT